MIIRPVRKDDFDQWLPLWEGYNAFYGREGATALDPEITRITWLRFLDVYEPMHALIAEVDESPAGICHYLFHRSTTAIEPNCYLQDLFTTESARGHGVGRALIEAVYSQARSVGATHVYWQTHRSNEQAMRLYNDVAEDSGFVVYENKV